METKKMKGVIKEFTKDSITFLEEGVEELQVFELGEYIKPEYFGKGRANLTVTSNIVNFVVMEEDKKEQKSTDKGTDKKISKKSYVVNIKGKDYMTYEGLLKKAHEKGEFSMEITEFWVSDNMKMAWCKVRLIAKKQIFDGIGSSTPDNTGTMTENHPVEMSHTRAKGRALRDYLNIGQVMAEEMKQ